MATNKPTKSALGELIRRERIVRGMSVKQLAQILGISHSEIRSIESGQLGLSCRNDLIDRIAQTLSIDMDVLQAARPKRKLRRAYCADTLGGFLTARRLELHLSQQAVANKAGTNRVTVNGIETERFQPSLELLTSLAVALECQIPKELTTPLHECEGQWHPRGLAKAFGEFVAKKRRALGLTQKQFAKKARTHASRISDIERGHHDPTTSTMVRICKAFKCDVPAEFLLVRSEETVRPKRAGINVTNKAVRILQYLLEKQNDGFVVCLRRGGDVVELRIELDMNLPR